MTSAIVLTGLLYVLSGPNDSASPPHASRLSLPLSDPHPLAVPLQLARRALGIVDQYAGHQVVLAKRERVEGRLSGYAYILMKIRHEPLSVYTRFLGPPNLRGREAIYVEGRNEGKVLGHGTGLEALVGTLALEPTSPLAMQDTRFPVTMAGLKNLIEMLIEIGERESAYGECEVTYYDPARVDGRECTCVEIRHPTRRDAFECYLTRIFFEHASKLPIRVEQYDWPTSAGEEPPLLGEYTFLRIALTDDLTDLDFDPRNPDYQFAESGK